MSMSSKQEQKTYTYPEFVSTFIPNGILERMDCELGALLGMHYPWQHRLYISQTNPRTGSVEVAKSFYWTREQVELWLKNFYIGEGYSITKDNPLTVELGSQQFQIFVIETETSFQVNISTVFQA